MSEPPIGRYAVLRGGGMTAGGEDLAVTARAPAWVGAVRFDVAMAGKEAAP